MSAAAQKTPDGTIIEHKLARVFKTLADEQNKAGKPYGTIQFGYSDIVERSDMKYESTISVFMTQLKHSNLVDNIQKGNHYQKSIWDVTPLLNKLNLMPKAKEAVVKPEVVEETVTEVQEEPEAEVEIEETPAPFTEAEEMTEAYAAVDPEEVQELNQSLQDMIDHIKSLPTQMIGYLEQFQGKLKGEDSSKIHELEEQVLSLMQEKEDLEHRDSDRQAEIANLSAEIQRVRGDMEKLQGEEVNVTEVGRLLQNLEDELNKFLDAPSWQYKGKANHFRKLFTGVIGRILDEVSSKEKVEV